MRDGKTWAAARCVGACVEQHTRQLQTATDLCQVIDSLRAVLQLFEHEDADNDSLEQHCLQQHAQSLGWPVLQQCFYEGQFPSWATNVLTVAAGEWLPQDQDQQLRGLIAETFHCSPPTYALAALVGHLSAVLPKHTARAITSNTAITALAADTAAELLVDMFAHPDSEGIKQLLQCSAFSPNDPRRQQSTEQQPAPSQQQEQWQRQQQEQQISSTQEEQQQQHPQQQQRQPPQYNASSRYFCAFMPLLKPVQVEEAAAQLAAVPDRAQQLPVVPPELQASQFVPHVLQQALSYLADQLDQQASSSSNGTTGSTSNSSGLGISNLGATPVSAALTALVLQKFVLRGYAKPAAATLLHLVLSADESTKAKHQAVMQALQQVLLKLSGHTSAAEKLLAQLLRLAGQQQQQQLPWQQEGPGQQQQQQHDERAQHQQQWQLKSLLCPLLVANPDLRHVAVQRLLVRRTLPLQALQLLLDVLHSCCPSLLPEASVQLAQTWGDQNSILQMKVSQQAYITTALAASIRQLPKDLLDPATAPLAAAAAAITNSRSKFAGQQGDSQQVCTGIQHHQAATLIPAVLQGVSARLASPSPAIRAQAMRVGRVFAIRLDPAKPLFNMAGDLPLMPEELWPGALGAQQQLPQPQQQQQQSARLAGLAMSGHAASKGSTCSSSNAAGHSAEHSSSSRGAFSALARLQQASLEPDSDDEDTSTLTSAGSAAANNKHQSSSSSTAGLPSPQQYSQHRTGTGGTNRQPPVDSTVNGTDQFHNSDSTAASVPGNIRNADDDALSDAGSEASSAASLVAFDLQEDPAAEEWWGLDGLGVPEGKAMGLRPLAAALRKQDDVNTALDALQRVEILVRAEPDELPVVAPELARALLHCRVPVWAAADAPTPGTRQQQEELSSSSGISNADGAVASSTGQHSNAEVRRQRALTAVLSLSPLTVGDTVITELYSPHLDQYQRMLILDCLAAAAVEMSDHRKAPRITAAAPGQAPKLLPSAAEARIQSKQTRLAAAQSMHLPAQRHPVAAGGQQHNMAANRVQQCVAAAPGLVECSSRVWGTVSLQKQKEAQTAAGSGSSLARPRTFKNRFAPVAVRWTTLLLKECDVRHHGIDLFGRDSLLLGRLLTVLGTFVEAAAATPAAVPLSVGLLEMLKAQQVSEHNEVFVRRCALVAAAQVVRHLPPARLAGAMVGRQQDVQDQVLVERLQWLMAWAQNIATFDVDEHCSMLAAGCCAWYVELAEGAMAALEHMPEQIPGFSSLTSKTAARKGAAPSHHLDARLPTIDRLVLS